MEPQASWNENVTMAGLTKGLYPRACTWLGAAVEADRLLGR
jgi:hypothetical protein